MVEKEIRGEVYYTINRNERTNNKYIKHYDNNEESSYLQCFDVIILYGWTMSQKLLVNDFGWIEETSQFNEDFIRNYNEESDKEYFLEVNAHYYEKSRRAS